MLSSRKESRSSRNRRGVARHPAMWPRESASTDNVVGGDCRWPRILFPNFGRRCRGPKAAKIIETDEQFVSPSYTRGYPCVAHVGRGMISRTWTETISSIYPRDRGLFHRPLSSGNRRDDPGASRPAHPHVRHGFLLQGAVRFGQEAQRLAPGRGPNRVFFTNSGAEAVEAALKLARYKTGRTRLIAYLGAFHGRTIVRFR